MGIFSKKTEIERPLPGEVEEAKRNANGWVYRIDGSFGESESVPPEKIVGAWKVNGDGLIVGSFVPNKKYVSQAAGADEKGSRLEGLLPKWPRV